MSSMNTAFAILGLFALSAGPSNAQELSSSKPSASRPALRAAVEKP